MPEVVALTDADGKRRTARRILEALPAWFGIAEAREGYIRDSAGQPCFACMEHGEAVGFLCLKRTGDATVELAVMGVLPSHQRQGIGTALVARARAYAAEQGYAFLQVKTMRMGMYAEYDQTNRFYQAMGFREFEVFPTLWDERNPCQVYVMGVESGA